MAFIQPYLTARTKVGVAYELTPGTFQNPTKWIPVSSAKLQNDRKYYADKSYRGRAAATYGHYRLVATGVAEYSGPLYPDSTSYWFLGAFGQDKITVAPSATTIAAPGIAVGATTANVAAGQGVNYKKGQAILVDTGTALEGNIVKSVATDAITFYLPFRFAHTAGAAFSANNLHEFRLTPNDRSDATIGGSAGPEATPHLSISDYFSVDSRQIPGAAVEELSIKWSASTEATYDVKLRGLPLAPGTFTPSSSSFTKKAPFAGWQAGALTNGSISNELESIDINIKRKVEPIFGGNNQDGPVAVLATVMEVTGKITAVANGLSDYNHFDNSDNPILELALAGFAPGEAGAHTPSGMLLTMNQTAYVKAPIERGKDYVQYMIEFEADDNATDDGPAMVYLSNDYATL